jgi:hypothetical protein
VPKPRVNLTRFHGVFAPNGKYRARHRPSGAGEACLTRRGIRTCRHRPDPVLQCPVFDYAKPAYMTSMAITAPRGHKGTAPETGLRYRYPQIRRTANLHSRRLPRSASSGDSLLVSASTCETPRLHTFGSIEADGVDRCSSVRPEPSHNYADMAPLVGGAVRVRPQNLSGFW